MRCLYINEMKPGFKFYFFWFVLNLPGFTGCRVILHMQDVLITCCRMKADSAPNSTMRSFAFRGACAIVFIVACHKFQHHQLSYQLQEPLRWQTLSLVVKGTKYLVMDMIHTYQPFRDSPGIRSLLQRSPYST